MKTWISNLFSAKARPITTRRRARKPRLILEALEDRTVPSVTLGNGSFEAPNASFASGGYIDNPPLQFGQPWLFEGGAPNSTAGVAVNGSLYTTHQHAPEGFQVAFVQGTGSISQKLDLDAGSYTVSFFAAQRIIVVADNQAIQVLIDGNEVGRITPGGGFSSYTTPAFSVAAGSHTLTFKGLNGLNPFGGDTALIDKVVLTVDKLAPTITWANPGPIP